MGRRAQGFRVRWQAGRAIVVFTHARERYRISLGTSDAGEAATRAAHEYAEVVSGRRAPVVRLRVGGGTLLGLDELLVKWIASHEGVLDWETVRTLETYARHYLAFFKTLDRMTEAACKDFGRARIRLVLRKTVQKELSYLRSFLAWCEEEKIIAKAPRVERLPKKSTGVRAGKQRKKPVEITVEQAERILSELPLLSKSIVYPKKGDAGGEVRKWPIRARFRVAWETGFRPETIDRLRAPENYRKGATHVELDDADDKARFGRSVPLTPAARAALDAVVPESGLIFGAHEFWKHLKKAAAKVLGAELAKSFAAYDFRHGRGAFPRANAPEARAARSKAGAVKAPVLRLHDELIVDNFAGGGGASLGIEWALGRSPDIAVNHDPAAIAMHQANHPNTRHLCGDVWDVDPKAVCGGQRIALAWFSPDCKHFSKAKGSKPVDKKVRGLAWVVVRWARAVRPRVIILENVEEFADWGPLLDDDRPDPARRGLTFRRWLGQLQAAGYVTEVRELRASDFGAPTSRKRLFVIARSDGQPIVWPEPTHGAGRSFPHRVAAECIQWHVPVRSIFGRKKGLAEATMRRIGRGVWRYVIGAGEPFIAPVTHHGDDRVHSLLEPVRTVTGAHRGELALVSPTLIQSGYGERPGQTPRAPGLGVPLGTVVAGGVKHALVSAFLAKNYGGHEGPGTPLTRPVDTVTCRDHHTLVATHMLKLHGTCVDGQTLELPFPTVRAQGTHLAEVRSFLVKYYGTGVGASLSLPLGTVTTRDRFGLVSVAGQDYAIADIGMRMLEPRELFRAQSFPDSYVIDPVVKGKPLTKTAQVRMCGNSVCPAIAQALVAANVARSATVAA
jgi:DNA (cytosine-5)-methyltransferase 1